MLSSYCWATCRAATPAPIRPVLEEQSMPTRIQFHRSAAPVWETANPVLADGEIGLETIVSPGVV